MPRRVYLTLAVVACLLGGCSRPNANAKYRIAVIPKGVTHEFWQSINAGAVKAQRDLAEKGIVVNVIWDGPLREDDREQQIQVVENFIAHGSMASCWRRMIAKPWWARWKPRCAARMPVVIIDSGPRRTRMYVKYVATDNYNGGRLAAEHLLDALAEAGQDKRRS